MDGGKLSMTLAKVLNVPKRFANQDDDRVLDEDAIVVVGATTKVFDKGGHGAPRLAPVHSRRKDRTWITTA